MTAGSQNTPALIRRLRAVRIRQICIAALSVLAAGIGICVVTPAMIGSFAFYAVTLLLVLNGVLALLQLQKVIEPTEMILTRINTLIESADTTEVSPRVQQNAEQPDTFAYLSAGIDELIEKLTDRARTAEFKSQRLDEIIQALPISLLVVTRTGKVASIIKNTEPNPLPGLVVGKRPLKSVWGDDGNSAYDRAIDAAFKHDRTIWVNFTLDLDGVTHHFLAALRRMSDIAAVVSVIDSNNSHHASQKFDRSAAGHQNASAIHDRQVMRHLAASVAHDCKNVFTALGNLAAINRESIDPAVREQVPIAEDAIHRGTNLLMELMSFAGDTKYELKRMNATEAIRNLVSNPTLKALCPDNIKIIVDLPESGLPDINVDLNQAWKVTFNLVKNAIEAIGKANGRIWMKAQAFEMTKEMADDFHYTGHLRTGHGILFSTVDDGPGIAPNMIAHVFDPYYSSKGRGRGLGLATTMTIVEAHNGAMRVISNKEHGGTNFEIFIPAAADEPEHLGGSTDNSGLAVLVIDDDKAILQTTALCLKSMKITPYTAACEDDVLRTLRTPQNRISAVLMDAHLYGETSAVLTRRLQSEFPQVPVIISSGSPEATIKDIFADVTYSAYLAKPYTLSELAQVLSAVRNVATA